MSETRGRSLVKTAIYRVLTVILGTGFIYLIFGGWAKSLGVALSLEAFHSVIYYAYERVWNRIAWGRDEES